MITNEKGYSLNVLIITIIIMIILTTTAIVTMRSLTADKEVTYFLNDLQEVENFAKEYYSRKGSLPIVLDENGNSTAFTLSEAMAVQAGKSDKGDYYQVDIDKLGELQLYDDDRGGYLINESSLKVYVLKPLEYNKVKYYTLTDDLLGLDKIYSEVGAFEIVVAGNPITWTSSFKLTVSIPDDYDVNTDWTFKYYENGPITAEQFKTLGTYFEYGTAITIRKNGIHSIYAEDDKGYAKVVNVVVTMVDEIDPYVYEKDGIIVASDDETGIKTINYKIQNYSIPESTRRNWVDKYTQGIEAYLPSRGGTWTYEEAYTGENLTGVTPSSGKSIDTYKEEYEKYLTEYNAIMNDPSGDHNASILDDMYSQFQYNGVPYSDDEKNIVLYVEDYAGNSSVTNSANVQCIVSRKMLLDSNFVASIVKPLNGARVVINDDDEYTNSRDVSLSIRAQGAESMFITTNGSYTPTSSDWITYDPSYDYRLPTTNGEVTVYVFVTANQYEGGVLKYERVSDKIILDDTPPTNSAPDVTIGEDFVVEIKSNQKDTLSGIEKIEYGYKKAEESAYKWVTSANYITFEQGQLYHVKTRATDRAGNTTESVATEIQAPYQQARTIPNEPKMATGMQAIAWDGTLKSPGNELEINTSTWQTKDGKKATWYDYVLGDGITDNKNSIWANAKTSDGSYWVWIPRYAYRIIYYKDAQKTQVNGYYQNSTTSGQQYFNSDGVTVAVNPESIKTQNVIIDVLFLYGSSNTQYREENTVTGEVSVKTLPSEYIVHPAFQSQASTSVNNSFGNWGSNVTGIWVAKFEASRSDATIDDEGKETTVKVVPSVKSWTNLSIGEAYDYCNEMLSTMYPAPYPHLMKNSEWGAVAYLAYSAYGRNGNEVGSNRSTDYITGGGGRSAYTSSASQFKSSYAYNAPDTGDGRSGMNSSTTGNIYGVYDMAGGVQEYMAAYLSNNNSAIRDNGLSITQTILPIFREVYQVAVTDAPINNYRRHGIDDKIYGNAIYETSTGYLGQFGINQDTSNYPTTNKPFYIRGGSASDATASGIFAFDSSTGAKDAKTGFRPVIIFN